MLEFNRLNLTLNELTHKLPEGMIKKCGEDTGITYSQKSLSTLKEILLSHERNTLKQIYLNIISIRKIKENHTDESVQSITNQINQELHYDFNWAGVDQVLDTSKKEVVEILPYLLASYIISYKKNKLIPKQAKSEDIEDNGFDEIFKEKGEVDSGAKTNYYKNVKSFTRKFSIHLSQSKEILSLAKKLELYKQQYAMYVKYMLENGISPFEECELKKPCEKTIGPIELTLIPWDVTFIKCISICKNIENVNFTLSTALFTLSVLNLLDDIDDANTIFEDSNNMIMDLQEQSKFEDYLRQDILDYCSAQVEKSHRKFTENEKAILLATGINLDEFDMDE